MLVLFTIMITEDIIMVMYNLIIVLVELSRLLKERNLLMPNEIHFQLDNCGDNKVFV
jgi:hypothetical protein